jgi:hypothetical protein
VVASVVTVEIAVASVATAEIVAASAETVVIAAALVIAGLARRASMVTAADAPSVVAQAPARALDPGRTLAFSMPSTWSSCA